MSDLDLTDEIDRETTTKARLLLQRATAIYTKMPTGTRNKHKAILQAAREQNINRVTLRTWGLQL